MTSNVIKGEGATSSDAWKEILEGFRKKFPNLESYTDKKLLAVLKKSGVRFTQTFGENPSVEANLEDRAPSGEAIPDVLSHFPPKSPRRHTSHRR